MQRFVAAYYATCSLRDLRFVPLGLVQELYTKIGAHNEEIASVKVQCQPRAR